MPKPDLRPMCFIAMPFGKRAPAGKKKPPIDFNKIYSYIARGAGQAGLEPIRADFEPSGGFIHKPMLERLLVAEYVIADLTLSNPNVTYEVGVRHGASSRATLLICAESFLSGLPFDVRPLRVIPYGLGANGSIGAAEGRKLAESLCERLAMARKGELPIDNPIMQVTNWRPAGTLEHSKTDVFLQRLQFSGELGERIRAAVALGDPADAVKQLAAVEKEVINLPTEVREVHTALLGVFLGYREKKAYQRMTSLFTRFPKELQNTPVAREQYALALNRLAEGEDRPAAAQELRRRALAAIDAMPVESVTSETYGIRGRIYKGWHDSLAKSAKPHDQARAPATLQAAIEAYEQGFHRDLRDYWPGVNAVTLRLLRGAAEDAAALRDLIPVVRYSVAFAPPPETPDERYWQTATRLELATAARDWTESRHHLTSLLALPAQRWMHETTVANLRRQREAFKKDKRAVRELDAFILALE